MEEYEILVDEDQIDIKLSLCHCKEIIFEAL